MKKLVFSGAFIFICSLFIPARNLFREAYSTRFHAYNRSGEKHELRSKNLSVIHNADARWLYEPVLSGIAQIALGRGAGNAAIWTWSSLCRKSPQYSTSGMKSPVLSSRLLWIFSNESNR
jgi:hypothetical protein